MNCYESIKQLLFPLKIFSFEEHSDNNNEILSYCFSLDKIEQLLDEMLTETFIQTSSSYGLKFREQLFSEKVKDTLSTDDRREMLMSLYRVSATDFNLEGIVASLTSVGIYVSKIVEDFENSLIKITIDNYKNESVPFEQIKNLIEKYMPAHLDLYIDSGYLTWDMFDAKDLTFDRFEEVIPAWDFFEMLGHTVN